MNKNAREDVSGWKTRGQEKNLSFNIGSKMTIQIHVLGIICGYRKENSRNPKKTKGDQRGPKKSCNMFWIIGEEHQEDVHGPWRKGRTDLRLGKG